MKLEEIIEQRAKCDSDKMKMPEAVDIKKHGTTHMTLLAAGVRNNGIIDVSSYSTCAQLTIEQFREFCRRGLAMVDGEPEPRPQEHEEAQAAVPPQTATDVLCPYCGNKCSHQGNYLVCRCGPCYAAGPSDDPDGAKVRRLSRIVESHGKLLALIKDAEKWLRQVDLLAFAETMKAARLEGEKAAQ